MATSRVVQPVVRVPGLLYLFGGLCWIIVRIAFWVIAGLFIMAMFVAAAVHLSWWHHVDGNRGRHRRA